MVDYVENGSFVLKASCLCREQVCVEMGRLHQKRVIYVEKGRLRRKGVVYVKNGSIPSSMSCFKNCYVQPLIYLLVTVI